MSSHDISTAYQNNLPLVPSTENFKIIFYLTQDFIFLWWVPTWLEYYSLLHWVTVDVSHWRHGPRELVDQLHSCLVVQTHSGTLGKDGRPSKNLTISATLRSKPWSPTGILAWKRNDLGVLFLDAFFSFWYSIVVCGPNDGRIIVELHSNEICYDQWPRSMAFDRPWRLPFVVVLRQWPTELEWYRPEWNDFVVQWLR